MLIPPEKRDRLLSEAIEALSEGLHGFSNHVNAPRCELALQVLRELHLQACDEADIHREAEEKEAEADGS
jgi:hypothetical protein